MRYLLIALGGALGSVLRYALSALPHRYIDSIFPWGTLFVNLLGSFFIGFFWRLSERFMLTPALRSVILVGFLGAFTTFSTFSLESFNLLRDGEYRLAAGNVIFSTLSGIFLVYLGYSMGRWLVSIR